MPEDISERSTIRWDQKDQDRIAYLLEHTAARDVSEVVRHAIFEYELHVRERMGSPAS
jgi:hypothetical protein